MALWKIQAKDFMGVPGKCVNAVRRGNAVAILEGNREIARILAEDSNGVDDHVVSSWSGRRPQPGRPPVARLRGPHTSLDFVRWSRGHYVPGISDEPENGEAAAERPTGTSDSDPPTAIAERNG